MKILLAVSSPFGSASGTAVYAQQLKNKLEKSGIEIKSTAYDGCGFFGYFWRVFKIAKSVDLVYGFNPVSVGLSVCLACFLRGKKFILRIGGDYLWERAVEAGRSRQTLSEYYQYHDIRCCDIREKFLTLTIKCVLKRASKIIFPNEWLRDIYQKHYGISPDRAIVIPNPFPSSFHCELDDSAVILSPQGEESLNRDPSVALGDLRVTPTVPILNFQILYAGRLIKLKNLATLIDAFVKAIEKTSQPLTLKIVGKGPEEENLKLKIENLKLKDRVEISPAMSHEKLAQVIAKSWLCVLPSLSEVSPNFALECLALNKPILLTKECGLYEQFKNDLIFINPQDPADMANKIRHLTNQQNYQNYLTKISQIDKAYSWPQTAHRHLDLFNDLRGN